MRRFLICFLLFAYLFSGMAYAWDTHPEAYFGHGVVAVSDATGQQAPLGDDGHTSDHCCHGMSHLLVMINAPVIPAFFIRDRHRYAFQIHALRPMYVAPLLRPPIA